MYHVENKRVSSLERPRVGSIRPTLGAWSINRGHLSIQTVRNSAMLPDKLCIEAISSFSEDALAELCRPSSIVLTEALPKLSLVPKSNYFFSECLYVPWREE